MTTLQDVKPTYYPIESLDPDYDDVMPVNVAELADQVVGHRIVSVEKNTPLPGERYWGRTHGTAITLDNGKRVFLADTDDCCAYTELEAFLLHPEMIDHVITGVGTTDGYTTWHIYADAGDVLELTVGWSPGSGYYGYGFTITIQDLA